MARSIALFCLTLILVFNLHGQSAIEFNELAQNKVNQGDLYGALEFYSKSLEINSDYHQSLFGMAETYFKLAEYDAAKSYIDKAKQFSKDDLEYINLEGRIMVGLGKMEEAYSIFNGVLMIEPYNLASKMGIAEIDLIENRFTEAESKYNDALIISPESKRALLSLLILYDSQGHFEKGEEILIALNENYSYEAEIKLATAEHYYRSGEFDRAEEYANNLISSGSISGEAHSLLAKIYLDKNEADKAIKLLEVELKKDKNDLELRYLLAMSFKETDRFLESIHNFDYIIKNAPYDEISRMAAEDLAIRENLQDKLISYGQYHFNEGKKYESSFRYDKALREYRRGLKINPKSIEGRLQYGSIFNKRGFPLKYLDILKLLQWNGYDDPDFIQMQKQLIHLKKNGISDAWNVDQFYILKNQYLVDLYIQKPELQSYHNFSEEIVASYFDYELEKYERLKQNREVKIIEDEIDAYKNSHSSNSDYYIIINYSENERIFSLDLSIYLSRTGVFIDRFTILRAGNNKIGDSIEMGTSFLNRFFPNRGSIVNIQKGKALINLGRIDGIEVEQKFLIVRKNKARYISESPWYEVADEDKLGILTVKAVDEAIAEGIIENPGFFDLVNPGDEIFKIAEDVEITLEPDYGYNQNLKRELLKIH